MFSRGKGAASSDKKKQKEKTKPGAHELFLEYEGFLAPSKHRPRTSSAHSSKTSAPLTHGEYTGHSSKLSEDSRRSSTASSSRPRKGVSSSGDANDASRSQPKRTPSQRTKNLFSFGRTTHGEPRRHIHNFSRPGPNYVVEKEALAQTNTSSWLRCYMNTSLKHRPSTPSSSMTPTPSYDGSLIFEEEDDITALPALPGCPMESARPSLNLASGAAARAAVAAQNEILDSMQKFTLAETHVTRDSESGVGIEVQDSGETIAEFDFDIPVVRQGMTTRGHHCSTSLILRRSSICSSPRTCWTHTFLSGC